MLYGILVLVCLLGCLVGVFYFIFKKGKRKKGGISALVLLVAALVFAGFAADDRAKKAGWESDSDMQTASKAGITDPKIYAVQKAKIEADAKAKADADAASEKAKADAATVAEAKAAAEAKEKSAREDAFFAQPSDEMAVVQAVTNARSQYENAQNDLAKGGIRRDRARAICNSVGSRTVSGWTGTLEVLTTNGDGLGVVTISIGDDVSVQTMNNALSDIGSNTLIDPDSAVFRKLSTLQKGQKVKFSGTFVSAPTNVDCLWEISISMDGSMDAPSFVMSFSDIQTN